MITETEIRESNWLKIILLPEYSFELLTIASQQVICNFRLYLAKSHLKQVSK